jgi:cytidylate kinase/RimJ/RimL family protein N-acetyltransferase
MIPEVALKAVSMDDVDRVGWWLEDEEVSARWFGHYGCGDPVHRGYDPVHMLESTDWEWQSVFGDSSRLIFSIYNDQDEHVGECQVLLDGEGGAELSLLIGRKDLWHHGYGTSTVLLMLDRIFGTLSMERAWVNVPEDNAPALGLFKKLGFVGEAARELCRRPDGTALTASILAIDAISYQFRRPADEQATEPAPVITITGLPGSGSEDIGAEIAKLLNGRHVDEEMLDLLCRRLRCSPGEIEGFETGHRSFWGRMFNSIVVPMEWSATYDVGYHMFRPEQDHEILQDQLTKERYAEGLKGIVRKLCAGGNVVLHGHGAHMFARSDRGSLSVFVSTSKQSREQRTAVELDMTPEEAKKWLKRADRETRSVFKNLIGSDLRDMGEFDIVLNTDKMSAKAAAKVVVAAVQEAAVQRETARTHELDEMIAR